MTTADLIIFSKAIFDSVHDKPFEGGIAVKGDRIEFVGTRRAVENYIGTGTVIRDYGDCTVMPGFCDGHAHLEGTATTVYGDIVSGLDTCKSEEEVVLTVKDWADKHPGLKRILGTNWYFPNWGSDAELPTRHSLDKVFPDIPVYLQSADGHCQWINTAAMKECRLEEIVATTKNFLDEFAPRDAKGEFTGFLSQGVSGRARGVGEKWAPEQLTVYRMKLVRMLSRYGITGFTECSLGSPLNLIESRADLKQLDNRGEMPIRLYQWTGFGPRGTADTDSKTVKALQNYFSSDCLKVVGIKSMLDGVNISYTSAIVEDYEDKPGVRGTLIFPREDFIPWLIGVNAAGLPVKIHCCGDMAVRTALDAFEASNAVNDNSGLPNAVEHAEIVHEEDYRRFGKLGVIASMQPAHLVLDHGIGAARFGKRSWKEWGFRRLLDTGAILSVGTDTPVVGFNPFHTIYKAVTRLDLDGGNYSPHSMDQALTLSEVLKAYTAGSSYANGMLHKVGTLEPGKYADIVVIDKNLFAVDPAELKDRRAVCTVFSGRIIYEEEK